MATKSKSDWSIIWSILAVTFALVSIGYCFTHIMELIANSVDRTSRAVAYFTRLVKGGTL